MLLKTTPVEKQNSLKYFNEWVQRFVGQQPLAKRAEKSRPGHFKEIEAVGNKLAIRGQAPVLGKFSGASGAQKGGVEFFASANVQVHDFLWAPWVNHNHKDNVLKEGLVDEKFFKDTANTLNMIRPLLADDEVLSLTLQAELMPQGEEEQVAYRDAFLQVVDRWAREQRIYVLLHGLRKRNVDGALKGLIEEDEVKIVESLTNPYLKPMPIDHSGVDMISSAIEFMKMSQANSLNTAGVNDAKNGSVDLSAVPVNTPRIVTLIPGDGWKHIGGEAWKGEKAANLTIEERLMLVSPMISYLFNFATNKMIRAKVAHGLVRN